MQLERFGGGFTTAMFYYKSNTVLLNELLTTTALNELSLLSSRGYLRSTIVHCCGSINSFSNFAAALLCLCYLV